MVIVDLSTEMADAEIRQMICDLWAIHTDTILVRLSGDGEAVEQFCLRLVETGFISMLVPHRQNHLAEDLHSAEDIYRIAHGSSPTDFLPLWESMKDRARLTLSGNPVN